MFFFYLVFCFLCASIPFGLIICFLGYNIDIRELGSKNIGMTNVYRNVGLWPALLTLFCDAGKTFLVLEYSPYSTPSEIFWIGLVAVLGHCYSVFLQGNGGKGVASAFGVCIALSCSLAISILGVWLIFLQTTKKSSASSLITLATLLPLNWYFAVGQGYLFLVLIILIVLQHKDNVQRLKAGGA